MKFQASEHIRATHYYFIFQAAEGDTYAPKSTMVKSELRSLKKMARRMMLCQEEKVRPHYMT
jgi:hypothetical protein